MKWKILYIFTGYQFQHYADGIHSIQRQPSSTHMQKQRAENITMAWQSFDFQQTNVDYELCCSVVFF